MLCRDITDLTKRGWGSNVLDNATELTVYNQNLRSSLYSDLPTWLNPKLGGYGPKTFRAAQGWEKIFGLLVGGLGACSPRKV